MDARAAVAALRQRLDRGVSVEAPRGLGWLVAPSQVRVAGDGVEVEGPGGWSPVPDLESWASRLGLSEEKTMAKAAKVSKEAAQAGEQAAAAVMRVVEGGKGKGKGKDEKPKSERLTLKERVALAVQREAGKIANAEAEKRKTAVVKVRKRVERDAWGQMVLAAAAAPAGAAVAAGSRVGIDRYIAPKAPLKLRPWLADMVNGVLGGATAYVGYVRRSGVLLGLGVGSTAEAAASVTRKLIPTDGGAVAGVGQVEYEQPAGIPYYGDVPADEGLEVGYAPAVPLGNVEPERNTVVLN